MKTFLLFLVDFTLITLLSAGLAYCIMRWTFSPSRHPKLFENFNGMNIAGLNSGAIILLAFGLAFVFSQISTSYQAAKSAVHQEADDLRTLGRISLNIDPAIGKPLMDATRLYTQTIIEKEWPKLNQGNPVAVRQGAFSALPPLTKMSDIVYATDNISKLPTTTSAQLGQLVTRIRENRLIRIDASSYSIGYRSLILAFVTLLSTSALISLSLLSKAHAQFVSNFTLYLVTLTGIYLAFVAQNPFAGLDSLHDTPLREALERLNNMSLAKSP